MPSKTKKYKLEASLINIIYVRLSFSLVWLDTDHLGDPVINGTYDGFIGSIQNRVRTITILFIFVIFNNR